MRLQAAGVGALSPALRGRMGGTCRFTRLSGPTPLRPRIGPDTVHAPRCMRKPLPALVGRVAIHSGNNFQRYPSMTAGPMVIRDNDSVKRRPASASAGQTVIHCGDAFQRHPCNDSRSDGHPRQRNRQTPPCKHVCEPDGHPWQRHRQTQPRRHVCGSAKPICARRAALPRPPERTPPCHTVTRPTCTPASPAPAA